MTVSSELDREPPRGLSERSVRATMLRVPKVLPSGARVADASELFEDDHVHAALVVDESGRLCSVVLREDLIDRDPEDDAAAVGRLEERTIPVDAGLEAAWRAMCELGQRRRAVVDPESGRLVGLLCLKRSGSGFCTDADAAARAADRGSQTQG